MDNKKIGATIYNLRKSLNLTQNELASKIFVSNKAISRWETGEGIPDISNLNELSKLFNVTIDYIIKGEGAESVDNINLENNKLANNMVLENKTISEEKQKVENGNNLNTSTDEHINKIIKQAEDRVNFKKNKQSSLVVQPNNKVNSKTKNNSSSFLGILSLVLSSILLFFSFISVFSFIFTVMSGTVLISLLVAALAFAIIGMISSSKGSTNRLLFTISVFICIAAVLFSLFFGLLGIIFLNNAVMNFQRGF